MGAKKGPDSRLSCQDYVAPRLSQYSSFLGTVKLFENSARSFSLPTKEQDVYI